MAGTYSDLVLQSSPLCYYRLNEASGNALDLGTQNLSLTVGVDVQRRQVGAVDGDTAMKFTGTNTSMCASAPGTFLSLPYTMECWINTSVKPGFKGVFLHTYTTSPAQGQVAVMTEPTSGKTVFQYEKVGGGNVSAQMHPVIVTDGAWHHVSVAFYPTPTPYYLHMLVDGQAMIMQLSADFGGPTTMRVAVGGAEAGLWPNVTPYIGLVDEVAIYPTALSDSVVASHFAAGPKAQGLQPPVHQIVGINASYWRER